VTGCCRGASYFIATDAMTISSRRPSQRPSCSRRDTLWHFEDYGVGPQSVRGVTKCPEEGLKTSTADKYEFASS
jgi:hypothetical protein